MAAGFVDYLRFVMGWWSSSALEGDQPLGSGFAVQAGRGVYHLQAGGVEISVMAGGGPVASQAAGLLSVVQAGGSGISVQWSE